MLVMAFFQLTVWLYKVSMEPKPMYISGEPIESNAATKSLLGTWSGEDGMSQLPHI